MLYVCVDIDFCCKLMLHLHRRFIVVKFVIMVIGGKFGILYQLMSPPLSWIEGWGHHIFPTQQDMQTT